MYQYDMYTVFRSTFSLQIQLLKLRDDMQTFFDTWNLQTPLSK